MAVNDPLEFPVGLRLVNPLLLDARRRNIAQTTYVDTAQVLSENVLAIRAEGQIFNVAGVDGIDEYWFRDGVADINLVLKSETAGVFEVVDTDPNPSANFNNAYKPISYLSPDIASDAFDFQHNWKGEVAGATTMGANGLAAVAFQYTNLIEGEVNFGIGQDNQILDGTTHSFVGGAQNTITSPGYYNWVYGKNNHITTSTFGQSFIFGIQNTAADSSIAMGLLLDTAYEQMAVGIGGLNHNDMAFRVGVAKLGTPDGNGDLTLNPTFADDNGLVVWKDGTAELPISTIANQTALGVKAIVTVEMLNDIIMKPTTFTITGGSYNQKVFGNEIITELLEPVPYTLQEISTLDNEDAIFTFKNGSGAVASINPDGADTIEGLVTLSYADGEYSRHYIKGTDYVRIG